NLKQLPKDSTWEDAPRELKDLYNIISNIEEPYSENEYAKLPTLMAAEPLLPYARIATLLPHHLSPDQVIKSWPKNVKKSYCLVDRSSDFSNVHYIESLPSIMGIFMDIHNPLS